jgi:hypothetical protein
MADKLSDQSAADAVRFAVENLNNAIADASAIRLEVRLDTVRLEAIGRPESVIVTATVQRPV